MTEKLPHYLVEEECKKLLEAAEKNLRDHVILRLALTTGLRSMEVSNLKIENINFNEGKFKVLGKGNKERYVVFVDNGQTTALLKAYLGNRKKGHVFITQRAKKISKRGLDSIIKKYAGLAGIQSRGEKTRYVPSIHKYIENYRVHFHTLRHTFAVLCLKGGMSLRTLQMLIGHESIDTTTVYLKLTLSDIKDDVQAHKITI